MAQDSDLVGVSIISCMQNESVNLPIVRFFESFYELFLGWHCLFVYLPLGERMLTLGSVLGLKLQMCSFAPINILYTLKSLPLR